VIEVGEHAGLAQEASARVGRQPPLFADGLQGHLARQGLVEADVDLL
jgi:hypothetical protein